MNRETTKSARHTAACLAVCLFHLCPAPVAAAAKLFETRSSPRNAIDDNSLTAADFYSTYLSKESAERRYAEMYLLGVMDASEGVRWCRHRTATPTEIEAAIHSGFETLHRERMKAKASVIIDEILSSRFRCEEKN